MSLIVEDGSGLPNANAYIDVAYADAYFALRGRQEWADLTVEKKEQSIVAATDYVETRWGCLFLSTRLTDTQALSFPRKKWDGIPDSLKKAVCEYAIRSSQHPLYAEPVLDESGFVVTETLEKVGPIQEKKSFKTGGVGMGGVLVRPYPAADSLMRGLVRPSNGRVYR
ncbi:hypothetical protein [Pseudomonas virus PBPA162]|uniref:Putative DnaT-like domain-containing protein n=2 Tax=Viruses TaxID=10239 RepID=A0A4Y5TPA3_9CAUD|nr:hypothetical protein PQC32_gp35 [Pseudomonas virus PBPA162]QDB70869.1 hypothetical protein [Pseudomonas virus PBPA162]WPK40868.1 head-tail adaptor [Pseudomonas phage Knedl]